MANCLTTTPPARIRHKIEAVRVIHLGGDNHGVIATAVSGAKYHLQHHFHDAVSAHSVAAKVACKGTIDPSLWDLVGAKPGSIAARHFETRAAA